MSLKKKYTNAEKIGIVKEGAKHGVKATLEKYGLYPATYYYWKKKYESMGDAGMDHGMTKERLKEIHRLEKENALLKQVLAEKELEIKFQQEIIKKKYR